MKLKILNWRGFPSNHHECRDEKGKTHRVDLLVSGCFPPKTDPKSLVGKTVEVEWLSIYCEIAHKVKIIETSDLPRFTSENVGRWVKYQDRLGGEIRKGRIKSVGLKWVFVVYHCDDNWKDYQNYTAAATSPEQLSFCDDPFLDLDKPELLKEP